MNKTENIHSLHDLIFENRNKKYGAYDLRINYNNRLNQSLLFTLAGLTALFLAFYISGNNSVDPVKLIYKEKIDFTKTYEIAQIPLPVAERVKHPKVKPPIKETGVFIAVRDSLKFQHQQDTVKTTALTDTGQVTVSHSNPVKTTTRTGPPVNRFFNQAAVDKQPEFPGGLEKFYKYLVERIRYTEEAKSAGLAGKMFISFIVDENGLISNIRILNRIGFGLEECVTNALKNSPQWSPGSVGEKPVQTEMILPVSFSLRK